jgi:hypothetical protein
MSGDEDGEAIEMAFSKKKVEDRKRWLSAFQQGTFLDQSVKDISYSDFVHKVRTGALLKLRFRLPQLHPPNSGTKVTLGLLH